jgi:hypothetical protein
MCGRFHIYLLKNEYGSNRLNTRSLCPECASRPTWNVREVYERNGGILCSGCGVNPSEYEKEHLPATIPTGGGCIIRA